MSEHPVLPFTGERYTPERGREIAYEHWHRYALARPLAAGRRVLDAACGEGYHDTFKRPKVDAICDVCGSTEFTRRKDDNAETMKTRMAAYRAQTEPLLPYYSARGVLRKVDGMASMDAVYGQISAVLAGT